MKAPDCLSSETSSSAFNQNQSALNSHLPSRLANDTHQTTSNLKFSMQQLQAIDDSSTMFVATASRPDSAQSSCDSANVSPHQSDTDGVEDRPRKVQTNLSNQLARNSIHLSIDSRKSHKKKSGYSLKTPANETVRTVETERNYLSWLWKGALLILGIVVVYYGLIHSSLFLGWVIGMVVGVALYRLCLLKPFTHDTDDSTRTSSNEPTVTLNNPREGEFASPLVPEHVVDDEGCLLEDAPVVTTYTTNTSSIKSPTSATGGAEDFFSAETQITTMCENSNSTRWKSSYLTTLILRSRSSRHKLAGEKDVYVYKTWMNELQDYSPEKYHLNKTFSTFVTLEGRLVRLQRPHAKFHIGKRVKQEDKMFPSNVQFVHQRVYNLTNAKVLLKPDMLVHKRQWSKKYPICIVLSAECNNFTAEMITDTKSVGPSNPPGSTSLRKRRNSGESAQPMDAISVCAESCSESFANVDLNPCEFDMLPEVDVASTRSGCVVSSLTELCVYFFTRTNREKEFWYHLFLSAAQGTPLVGSLSQLVQDSLQASKVIKSTNPPQPTKRHSDESDMSAFVYSQPVSNPPGGNSCSMSVSSKKMARNASSQIPGNCRVQPGCMQENTLFHYLRHMAKFMPAKYLLKASMVQQWNMQYITCDPQCLWINALIGRMGFDLLRENYWWKFIKRKFIRKLRSLRLPSFVTPIRIVRLELGSELPCIRRAHPAYVNGMGVWTDMDIAYFGGFSITVRTHVDLQKLWDPNPISTRPDSNFLTQQKTKERRSRLSGTGETSDSGQRPRRNQPTSTACSNVESISSSVCGTVDIDESTVTSTKVSRRKSGASSSSLFPPVKKVCDNSDDEDDVSQATSSNGSDLESEDATEVKRKPLENLLIYLKQAQWFLRLMEWNVVQSTLRWLRQLDLVLEIEVIHVNGVLSINLPPPPSDRVWYGFREPPKFKIVIKPRIGSWNITIPRIIEWMEEKIMREFERVLVYPNMDDFVVPVMLDNDPKFFGHTSV